MIFYTSRSLALSQTIFMRRVSHEMRNRTMEFLFTKALKLIDIFQIDIIEF